MSLRSMFRCVWWRPPLLLSVHQCHSLRALHSSSVFPKANLVLQVKVRPISGSEVPEGERGEGQIESKTPLPALLEMNIQKAGSVEELLQFSCNPTILLKHTCLILLRLGQLAGKDKQITYENLNKDERFARMCNLVQRGDYSNNPHLLFAAIQGLENLGIHESVDIYQTLSIELKWAMRRCPVRYLARAIVLFAPSNRNRDKEKQGSYGTDIMELAIHTLQRRWVEVASGSDFIAVFKIMHHFDEGTRKKLEDRAVEMTSAFTPSEMRQIFITLASQKRRPTPLLRTLSFHLSKAPDAWTAKDLIELTYALNELTFADSVLMEKIFTNLCPEIPAIENTALISSLVTSLGQMRFKHKGLLNILDEWIMNHLENLRTFDFAAWLLMSAVLNHRSDNLKEFATKACSVLSPKTSSSTAEWVNIVHSLLILNLQNDEVLGAALSPEVVKAIEVMGPKSSKLKVKLLNLNAAAKRSSKSGYKGPLLPPKTESLWASSVLSSSDPKLSALGLESINSFLTAEKYLAINHQLPCGVFVDAICYLDKTLKPIPKVDASNNSGAKPVAIVVEGYTSMTLGVKEPTGHTMLNRRLLQGDGYEVLSLPYTEFSATEKLINRAKYIEQKLKSIGK